MKYVNFQHNDQPDQYTIVIFDGPLPSSSIIALYADKYTAVGAGKIKRDINNTYTCFGREHYKQVDSTDYEFDTQIANQQQYIS